MVDKEFLKFFSEQFKHELDGVLIPGMPQASWDRKAAYLLWLERQPSAAPDQDDLDDLL